MTDSKHPGPMRFTHLHLENWRNFSLADVDLRHRVFLVGPNASGKSNFLDVFRFLHDVVQVGGGLQAAVNLRRGGVSKLRCLGARRHSDIVVKVTVGTDDSPDMWTYDLTFNQDNRQRPQIKSEVLTANGKILISRPRPVDDRDTERLTQTALEQVNFNQRFRDLVAFLSSIKYMHLVPQLIRDPDRSVGKANDPYGGDFLEQIARTPERTRVARLRRILEALKVAVPQLQYLELARDVKGTPHLRGKFEHWRLSGAWQQEDQFSDGTLRLTGLLWALIDGSGPLLLEEPELSLHPALIRYLPQMFSRVQRHLGRQILTSTHSSELLYDEGIGLDEVLLLIPGDPGTTVTPASRSSEIRELLDGGLPLSEAIMPHIAPRQAAQLSMFG